MGGAKLPHHNPEGNGANSLVARAPGNQVGLLGLDYQEPDGLPVKKVNF